MRPGYKKRGWIAIAISLAALAAAIAVNGNSAQAEARSVILMAASAAFVVGLVLFLHGKGYSALVIVALLIVPTLISELLPWHSRGGVGGLVTVLLIVLLPDRTQRMIEPRE